MSYQRFSLCFGFSVWLLATLIFSFWGQFFFIDGNIPIMLILYVGSIPILFVLMNMVFSKCQLAIEERIRSSVLLALPGMLLDTFCIKYYEWVFPHFSSEKMIMLSSWIVWVYTVVLFLGITSDFFNRKKG